jgi:hypothetical protein
MKDVKRKMYRYQKVDKESKASKQREPGGGGCQSLITICGFSMQGQILH